MKEKSLSFRIHQGKSYAEAEVRSRSEGPVRVMIAGCSGTGGSDQKAVVGKLGCEGAFKEALLNPFVFLGAEIAPVQKQRLLLVEGAAVLGDLLKTEGHNHFGFRNTGKEIFKSCLEKEIIIMNQAEEIAVSFVEQAVDVSGLPEARGISEVSDVDLRPPGFQVPGKGIRRGDIVGIIPDEDFIRETRLPQARCEAVQQVPRPVPCGNADRNGHQKQPMACFLTAFLRE